MRQVTAMILAHSGFDSAQQSTVNLLVNIGVEYFQNLGKTLRMYIDRFGEKTSAENVLLMSLQANGVENIDRLDQYIRFDVLRHGVKLFDLQRRLEGAWKTLNDGQQAGDTQDIDLDEMEGNIVSGNFFEELGIDLLNLQELGLDITSIPSDLWNKKAERPIRIRKQLVASLADEEVEEDSAPKYKPARPWAPVKPAE
ncbi:Transcriptional activator spt7, partial [Cladochytrium tenue]